MHIDLTIARQNLGDLNTAADNDAYLAAVEAAIAHQYPGYAVSVSLSDGFRDEVSAPHDEDIIDTVLAIAQDVWSEAAY